MSFFRKKVVEDSIEESRVDEFLRTEERNVVLRTKTPFGEESGFSLKSNTPQAEAAVPEKKKITVEEIHHSFLTAMDALLNTEGILKEQKEDADSLRLHELGFTSVEKIQKEKEKSDQKIIAMNDIELTKYYAHHYPQNKFITDIQLNVICNQYNLVLGEPKDYKGDIPQRCIKEIANFKLKEKDEIISSRSSNSSRWYRGTYFAIDKDTDESTEISIPRFLELIDKCIGEYNSYANWIADLKELKLAIKNGKSKYIGSYSDEYGLLCGGLSDVVGTNRNFLKVVAPENMMNMDNKRLDEKNRIVDDVKDPIVLCPVKGGNLIISLWGAESEIEELQNPNLN